ncbi:hypothetical protein NECAME_05197 [Necator americanus]|uniref:Uncharacterized protein n=1 Tax=Necator americanus TaxID=51031 RepID=W2SJ42_NECAM|nr:hypothetical protein NECAME_05197 [Necator americanus]ETN69615.1 hypothetical protein NECAME_05197 [Necator americanus]
MCRIRLYLRLTAVALSGADDVIVLEERDLTTDVGEETGKHAMTTERFSGKR